MNTTTPQHPEHSKNRPENRNDSNARFTLGQVVATPGALAALQAYQMDPAQLLHRHVQGDWGTLDPDDSAANEYALQSGERLLSNYPLAADCRIWIITEWDRSVTTLLLPEEY